MNATRLSERIVNATLKRITRMLCRIDDDQLRRVPPSGPLILVSNHVNFLEVPIVYTHLQPRPITGFAKVETWDNRLMATLFDLWDAIPIKRGQADLAALREGLEALKKGRILAVAPEGTRSGDGRLQQAQPGIVLIALKSRAPILPLVVYGGEGFWPNFKRLRRTDFNIRVGNPFYLTGPAQGVSSKQRQRMLSEIMYQLAALLPPFYRGAYAELAGATTEYLTFPSGSQNNIPPSST
jgi:1-acyl-sn-glycerol-3-phosphate acyltransferase